MTALMIGNTISIVVLLFVTAKLIYENEKIKKTLHALIESQTFTKEAKSEKKASAQPSNYLRNATYQAYKRHNQDYLIGGDD